MATEFKKYDIPEARRYIDYATEQDAVYGLNGCVGELLVVLKSLVDVIRVHYPCDHFGALEHAQRLLDVARDQGKGSEER